MNSQRRERGVPKAEVGGVTQVPENSLHRLPMRSPRRRLKTSAQTPGKIRIRKTMKSQRRERGVPKAEVGGVTQVPENSLHRLPMRSPRRRLKTSAQTPGKIRIRKTMKSQRREHGVPKAEVGGVTQVPENSLHRLPMRSPRRRLKTSAQTYRELDVRPRRRQVEE
jgi:ABC-type dipeptide/oligopeptide/nickel transport system ATPase subunit